MNILVNTSVWSLALRRAKRLDSAVSAELAELIREGRVVMLGAVRQEVQYAKLLKLHLHEPRA